MGGCTSDPPAPPLDLHWEFLPQADETTRACLPEEDVAKLREALDRCRAGTDGSAP